MEPIHILILGGDVKFLPLAKSKVRALAERVGPTGYASEKLIIEGTTILVEVKRGIQRITMDGSGGLFMDSGAVDIQTVGLLDPTAGQTDGILYYGGEQQAKVFLKKLLGKISIPSLTCKPPLEATPAKSFKAKLLNGVRVTSSEELLAIKKLCSKLVPPSLFTGKMRLFIQAKYGRALDEWDMRVNLNDNPPSLLWGDFKLHPGVCGIFTTAAPYGDHWLIQIGMDGQAAYEGITAHKLTSDVEILRKVSIKNSGSGVGQTYSNAEPIEAYLFSASKIDKTSKLQVPLAIPTNSSMGYGWHFSWIYGDKADIIEHIPQEFGSGYQYEARHHRLTTNIIYQLAGNPPILTASIALQESAIWGNDKWRTVITYPDWASQTLSVFGSHLGLRAATDAPIYCFWRRNPASEISDSVAAEELEIIRYSYGGGGALLTGEFISVPPYYWGITPEAPGAPTTPPCGTQGVSVGLEATRYDSITYTATATTTSFSSLHTSFEMSSRSRSSGGIEGTTKAVSKAGLLSGPAGGYPQQNIYDGPSSMPVFPGGNYCAAGAGSGALTGTTPFGGTWNQYYSRVTWMQYQFSETITETFASVLVIPFGDAEAAYVYAKKYRMVSNIRNTSRVMDSTVSDPDYVTYKTIDDGGGNLFEWVDYGSGIDSDHDVAAPLADGTVTETPEADRWTLIGSKLINSAGSTDTDWAPGGAFFAGDPVETVEQQLLTLTSALQKAVKGEEIDITGGYPDNLNAAPFVFVGWA